LLLPSPGIHAFSLGLRLGDLHPGNVFISRDGNKFILFDVGMVTEYSESDHQAIVDILAAFIQKEGRRAGELMIDETHRRNMAVVGEDKFLDKMDALTKRAASKESYLMQKLGVYISYICDAAAEHHVRIISPFMSMALAVKVQEGIALALDPSIPIIKVATPIIIQSESRRKLVSTWNSLGRVGDPFSNYHRQK
jgi:aarF domain-containing kinase